MTLQNFFELNQNKIFFLINFLFLLTLAFFFDIITVIISFTLWCDLYLLFYFIYACKLPLFNIFLLCFILFRFIKFVSFLNFYVILIGFILVLFVCFLLFKTKHLNGLKKFIKEYRNQEILISNQVRTKFFLFGVLSSQCLMCSLLVFWYFLLDPHYFLILLSKITGDKQVILLSFLFLFLGSISVNIFIEFIVIQTYFQNSGLSLLGKLNRIVAMVFGFFLSLIFVDYVMLSVTSYASGSELLISSYRIWRVGYSYNLPAEFSLAQRYSSLTDGLLPPVVAGTKAINLPELEMRLNTLDLAFQKCAKDVSKLTDGPYTLEEYNSLHTKHRIRFENIISNFESADLLESPLSKKPKK